MKFICIGKNYLAHAQELGGTVPSEPMFFFKPENAVPAQPGIFPYPDFSTDVHYEAELAVLIDKKGRNIPESEAAQWYSHVSVGLDFTARDLQRRQTKLGFPWEVCKAFEDSAPVGPWVPLAELGKDIQELSFELRVNEKTRQQGFAGNMIFSVNRLISHISRFVTLDSGDILLTGTPEGVGAVVPGDKLEVFLEGKKQLEVGVF
jgi:2-keto-4-pentenoate hydratase/2-oxohepta-3-ene-1,7-dioic acid hydratase in catechol pathway